MTWAGAGSAGWWPRGAGMSGSLPDQSGEIVAPQPDPGRLRDQLGILTEPLEEELAAAAREQADWLGKLVADGVLDESRKHEPVEVMLALHRYLKRTPSKVLLANLTDAVGERRAQNQPGTIDEYPNCRVPLADQNGHRLSLEDVFAAQLPQRLAAVMNGLPEQPVSRWG